MATIQELKAHLAHALPQATTTEVIKRALQETLARKIHSKTHAKTDSKTRKAPEQAATKTPPAESDLKTAAPPKYASRAETRCRVFARAQNRCEYTAPDGKRCAGIYSLELDHHKPRALGGDDTLGNLRVLCRSHNGFEAARVLGAQTMQFYLPSLRSG